MNSLLHTDQLTLIPLTAAHVLAVFALHAHPEVAAFNSIGIPKNQSTTEAILAPKLDPANKDHLGWIIANKQGVFMGEISLILAPERFKKGEISYSLHPDYWGNGFATAAVKALLEYAFNSLDLHRVEAGVAWRMQNPYGCWKKWACSAKGATVKFFP